MGAQEPFRNPLANRMIPADTVAIDSNALRLRMSALGQKRTFRSAIAMSALPPKADIGSGNQGRAHVDARARARALTRRQYETLASQYSRLAEKADRDATVEQFTGDRHPKSGTRSLK
jgi:hypothetical protein